MSFPTGPGSIPGIKLELEHMRHSLAVALSEYTVQLDEQLKRAVEAYCSPENLARGIDAQITVTLDTVIKEEVENWFLYGEGRKAIKAAVIKKLEGDKTYTPLDFVE